MVYKGLQSFNQNLYKEARCIWEGVFQISSHPFVFRVALLMSLLSPQTSGVLPFIVLSMFVRSSYLFLEPQNHCRKDIIMMYLVLSLGGRHSLPSAYLLCGECWGWDGPCNMGRTVAIASSHPDGPLRRPPGLDLEEGERSCPVERLLAHS